MPISEVILIRQYLVEKKTNWIIINRILLGVLNGWV